jgi:dUTP pyrophosphatase
MTNAVQVRIMRLPHAAHFISDLPLPSYENANALSLDLLASIPIEHPITISPSTRAVVPTGLAFALPPGIEGQVRPRFGLAVHFGVTAMLQTFDTNYRGELHVVLFILLTDHSRWSAGCRSHN